MIFLSSGLIRQSSNQIFIALVICFPTEWLELFYYSLYIYIFLLTKWCEMFHSNTVMCQLRHFRAPKIVLGKNVSDSFSSCGEHSVMKQTQRLSNFKKKKKHWHLEGKTLYKNFIFFFFKQMMSFQIKQACSLNTINIYCFKLLSISQKR